MAPSTREHASSYWHRTIISKLIRALSIFFSALSQALEAQCRSMRTEIASHDLWRIAAERALLQLYTYTKARPPSRTLVDPLSAFIDAYSQGKTLRDAVEAVRAAADNTRNIEAKAGRSAYVGGDHLKSLNVADPGAWGVKVILENLLL